MTAPLLHLPGHFLKSSLPQTYTKASLGLNIRAPGASITGALLPPAGPTCLTGPPPTPIGLPLSSHLCKYKPAERESLGLKDVPDLLPKRQPPPHPGLQTRQLTHANAHGGLSDEHFMFIFPTYMCTRYI